MTLRARILTLVTATAVVVSGGVLTALPAHAADEPFDRGHLVSDSKL